MVNKKRRIFIDFKENFQKKTRLIEDLKILISNDLKLEEKENIFKNIRISYRPIFLNIIECSYKIILTLITPPQKSTVSVSESRLSNSFIFLKYF